jgi:UTP--glucose-1-phosphate uridylyltransferase
VPRAVQLKQAYERTGKSVISLIEIEPHDADKYGMAAIGDDLGDGTFKINELVEKPGPEKSPSNFASVGGFLLTPDILPIIAEQKTGKGGEMVLADSINELAGQDAVYGQFIEGVWHDTGDQLKYLMALVDVALATEAYSADFSAYLKKRL